MEDAVPLEFAGGQEVLHRLEGTFYGSVLKNPSGPAPACQSPDRFTAESFGGPDRFTQELGFGHLIDVHRNLRFTEEQRQRFVELHVAAMDAADLPHDQNFRDAVRSHVEFGSKVAMQNPHAETDDELHQLLEVPRWTRSGDD